MKIVRIFKGDPIPGRKVVGLITLAVFLLLLILAPNQPWADVIFVQHDLPKPAPPPETSKLGELEFDLRKTPSLTHKTPNLSPEKQDEFGLFLDKNRHGLGLQWEPGGKIPSVDLGLETHNLYSLNRLLPTNEPYPNWTPQSDSQYFGNPRTAPDHSGAFLRFRW